MPGAWFLRGLEMEKELPDWAPDNCPPNVVRLIEHDDFLNQLKLRGLASADSKTLHAAVERLKYLLLEQRRAGYKTGAGVGFFIGPNTNTSTSHNWFDCSMCSCSGR